MKKRLLAIFIVIVMLLSTTTVFASIIDMESNNENDIITETEKTDSNHSCSTCSFSDSSNDALYLNDSYEFLNANQTNTVAFILKTEKGLKEITNEGSGFEVVSCRYENDSVYVEFTYNVEYEKPQLKITVLFEDNSILSANMYGYYYDNKLFVSGASKDDAFEKYCLYLLNSQEISEAQYKTMRNSHYAQSITITTSTEPQLSTSQIQGSAEMQASGSTTYLRGTLVWVDDWGVEHPCQYIKINVYDKEEIIADQLITTTYTNAGGFYSISFENDQSFFEFGNDLFIEIFAEGEGISVKNNSGVTYSVNTRGSTISNVANGTTNDISVKFEMSENGYFVGGDLGRAMQISQPTIVASRYAKAMNNTNVYYPASGNNCWYSNGHIYICSQIKENALPSHASWDAIMHEYGHHVQYQIGITENSGGNHVSSNNDIDIKTFTDSERKEKGVKLAWAEAWPTVFAIMAQQYYSNELLNIQTVGDANYDAYNPTSYSLEIEQLQLGEGCERSIMCVLYDLYDSGTNESFDTVALGHQAMWNLVDASNATTFYDLINYIYNTGMITIDAIGYILEISGMAVSDLSIFDNTIPSFLWYGEGGSIKHPYNSFSVVFAKPSNQEIFRTSPISTNQCFLTEEEWGMILSSGSTTIKWRVLASEMSNFPTGPYSSAWRTFNIPEITTLSLNTPVNGYATSGEYTWYSFTANTSGYYVFYTEGTTDTEGELYSLIPYDDSVTGRLMWCDDGHTDSQGNSTNMGITYELEAGQTVYIKVGLHYVYSGQYVMRVSEYPVIY